MNPNENGIEDTDLEDAIGTVMQGLPKPLQDFLLSEERGNVARELSAKYNLHVDQAGEFETAYLHMLLGIAKPDEFVATLSKAGLSRDVINGLAADVNTRVFMRLREETRRPANPSTQEQETVLTKPAPLPPPALEYRPTEQSRYEIPVPQLEPVAPISYQVPPTPHYPPATPQPGWHSAAAVHIYVPSHGAPMQVSQPETPIAATPVPRVPATPTYVPGQEPVRMQAPPTPLSSASVPAHPAKDPTLDPYRESV